MRRTCKPVRKCYSCPLNLGDHCWLYAYPRGQWRKREKCPAFDSMDARNAFAEWMKQPTAKTRKELRREYFRSRRRKKVLSRAGF